jgi:hypothetical protein
MGRKSRLTAPSSSVIATESVDVGQKSHSGKIVRGQSIMFEAQRPLLVQRKMEDAQTK